MILIKQKFRPKVLLLAFFMSFIVTLFMMPNIKNVVLYVLNTDPSKLVSEQFLKLKKIPKQIKWYFNNNPSDLTILKLHLNNTDLRKIDHLTKLIGENGILRSNHKLWFDAKMQVFDRSFNIKTRIRGDQSTHWLNRKKSWRIKFQKQELWQQRREINLIIVRDKFVEIEEVAYQFARLNGLLVPDSGFVLVEQNSIDMGLYYWIEQFDKNALERLQYPEGEIFSGDDVGWDEFYGSFPNEKKIKTYVFNPATYKRHIHQSGEKSIEFQHRFNEFLTFLRDSNSAQLEQGLSDFLNIEQYAKWQAIINIFANFHGTAHDNVKWYLNSATGLFEPILYDVQIYKHLQSDGSLFLDLGNNANPVIEKINRSSEVTMAVDRALVDLAVHQKSVLTKLHGDIIARIEPYLDRGVEPLSMSLPGVGFQHPRKLHYNTENRQKILNENLEIIGARLSTSRVFANPTLLQYDDETVLEIQINSEGAAPLGVKKLTIVPMVSFTPVRNELRFSLTSPDGRIIGIRPTTEEYLKSNWVFTFDNLEITPNSIKQNSQNKGEAWHLRVHANGVFDQFKNTGEMPNSIKMEVVNLFNNQYLEQHLVRISGISADIKAGLPRHNYIQQSIPNQNSFRQGDADDRRTKYIAEANDQLISEQSLMMPDELLFPAGVHIIETDLITPRGVGVTISAGAQLLLGPSVNIVINGPLRVLGKIDRPVSIRRLLDDQAWGLIGVVGTKEWSKIEFGEINGGGSGLPNQIHGINFNGQINFHYSPVEILNSTITNSGGEDALNIVKTQFKISNVNFTNNRGDAFDGDWVKGTIDASSFAYGGNDGLDISGSRVKLSNSSFSQFGDKAISVGEQSLLNAENIRIGESLVGVAVKDLSKFHGNQISIDNNAVGLALYRKKPLFGGGFASGENFAFNGNMKNLILDGFSNSKIQSAISLEPQPQTLAVGNHKELSIEENNELLTQALRTSLPSALWAKLGLLD